MKKYTPVFPLFLLLFIVGQSYGQSTWLYLYKDSVNIDTYLKTLDNNGFKTYGYSKWEHAIGGLGQAKDYPFVQKALPMGKYKVEKTATQSLPLQYGRGDWQLSMLGLDSFHKLGYTGKGITIALLDAGFFKVDSFAAFDSLWQRNQIKYYYDFVDDDTTVFDADGHGMSVLSLIAANIPDSLIGAAPDAQFILMRTEDAPTETHKEEFNWIRAMEKADSLGADIIHSSLGYSVFDSLEGDYTYFDMDGKSTFITRATDDAFRRGMFVTNSAGNEGQKPWKYITAPCDGQFVLCVGAVDSSRKKAGFSSFGPSADNRIKPEVMAMGHKATIINNLGYVSTGSGTSFSGPIMAGFVACLKQAHPLVENYRIYQAIIRSADKYNQPDSAYGYGLPNILKADSILKVMASLPLNPVPNKLTVYPNPGNNSFKIASQTQVQQIEIKDVMGNVVHQLNYQPNEEVKLNVASGVYFIYLKHDKSTTIVRWINN